MSLIKTITRSIAKLIPSPITVDFEKGGGRFVQEVAPYPPGIVDESVPIHKTDAGLEYVRTPDARFENLPGYDFNPNYIDIEGMRMHYVDEGEGPTILMLHGQPSWSFLYRKMIVKLAPKGYRCIAPDMIGMGKSDKPIDERYHTYDKHCETILAFIKRMNLKNITLFIQDWGSLIGLRLAGENSELFSRVVLANGDLPVYKEGGNPLYVPNPVVVNPKVKGLKMAMARYAGAGFAVSFQSWILFCLTHTKIFSGEVLDMMTGNTMSPAEKAAYDAPFPSFIYNAGPRCLPAMAVGLTDQTRPAWEALKQFDKPFLSIIGLKDRLLGRKSLQKKWIEAVPGAKGQNHRQIAGAHHFIQEDSGVLMAEITHEFIQNNPG